MAAVSSRWSSGTLSDQRVADPFRLETEVELRAYLWRAFAYLAEDGAGKLGNDS